MNMKKVLFVSGMILVAGIILGYGSFSSWRLSQKDLHELSLDEAAKIGKETTLQLLIQIEKPKGEEEGQLERGDVVLAMGEGHQFSIAEKTGFLVIKIRVTPKQAELLTLPSEEKKRKDDDADNTHQVKPRKFAVDLEKIGITDKDEKGRVIENKTFTGDILVEK